MQRPTIYVPFGHIIMYILQFPHDIYVHLFCFDLHKLLLRSRAATCPISNCVSGTSLFPQELVYYSIQLINNQYSLGLELLPCADRTMAMFNPDGNHIYMTTSDTPVKLFPGLECELLSTELGTIITTHIQDMVEQGTVCHIYIYML